MSFIPAVREQRFVLEHIAGIDADDDVIEAVLEGIGRFAASEWAPLRREGDVNGPKCTPRGVTMPAGYAQAYRAYVEGGWGTIDKPPEFGGQGLPFTLASAVIETLGSANMAFALAPILTMAAIEALIHHGTPAQQATYLPHLVTGAWTGTMVLTEPQAGTDVGALKTRANPTGDGRWRITGTKIFISFGDHDMAENIVHLVLARTPGAPEGTRGISMFLVPKYRLDGDGRPGAFNDIRTASIEHKMGLHASPTCMLSFGDNDDCIGELIGPENGGMRAMFTVMNNARLMVGLQGVQTAEAATQQAVAYARDRIQGAREGRPAAIVEYPDVRRMLMRMKAQTQAARALVYFAAAQVDKAVAGDASARDRLELLTPLAKAHATDIGIEVASLGVQVHGGMGFIEETGAAQFLRDARIAAIYEGTNGVQAADLVARKLGLAGGDAFARLIADMRAEARAPVLCSLIDTCDEIGKRLTNAAADDRLAASYPFLTMLSVAVCGWLMERQGRAATEADCDDFFTMKRAVTAFYGEQVMPEALGMVAAASAPAASIYAIPAALFSV